MCDMLMTKDGYEIRTMADMRAYGIPLPGDDDDCLCGVPSLKAVLADDAREWKFTQFCPEWSEVGPDGKTWNEGYVEDPAQSTEFCIVMVRPDGREPAASMTA